MSYLLFSFQALLDIVEKFERQTDPYGKAMKKQKNKTKNIYFWTNCLKNNFFVLLFCLLLHRLAVRISLPFIFFYKFNCTDPGLQLRRDGTTQRFVVVDLLTFYIFWNLPDIVHSGTIKERLIQRVLLRKQTFLLTHRLWGTFREEERLRLSSLFQALR